MSSQKLNDMLVFHIRIDHMHYTYIDLLVHAWIVKHFGVFLLPSILYTHWCFCQFLTLLDTLGFPVFVLSLLTCLPLICTLYPYAIRACLPFLYHCLVCFHKLNSCFLCLCTACTWVQSTQTPMSDQSDQRILQWYNIIILLKHAVWSNTFCNLLLVNKEKHFAGLLYCFWYKSCPRSLSKCSLEMPFKRVGYSGILAQQSFRVHIVVHIKVNQSCFLCWKCWEFWV